jgi:hypothetical protein
MQRVPVSLLTLKEINGYSDESQARKDAMHKHGAKFLKGFAQALGLTPDQFSVRSNKAGIAVSGEVTLHADHLYVQLCESFGSRGLQLLYRTCTSQKDFTGGQNRYVTMAELDDPEKHYQFFKTCQKLIASMQLAQSKAAA